VDVLLSSATALWLGVLTSISPCPLASNIAAVSWLGTRNGRIKGAIAAGLLYTVGRVVAYVALGVILATGALALPAVSQFLQRYGTRILGPVLVLIGIFVLELIRLPLARGASLSAAVAERARNFGSAQAIFLGFLFALSFCPVSAALFFGSLVPLAIQQRSTILAPVMYGIGTGLPVILASFLLSFAGSRISERLARINRFELWARRVTGVVFIGAGIYLRLKYIFLLIP
jgi:cytochrome c-type biogenesis protein